MAIVSGDNINFEVIQGDTFSLSLQYVYTDQNGVDKPIDITDYTFTFEVRDKPAGNILCATCTIGDGITVTDLVNGKIYLEVTPAKTKKFNYPKSAFQLQAHNGTQNDTWIMGWFKVDPGVIQ